MLDTPTRECSEGLSAGPDQFRVGMKPSQILASRALDTPPLLRLEAPSLSWSYS